MGLFRVLERNLAVQVEDDDSFLTSPSAEIRFGCHGAIFRFKVVGCVYHKPGN